MTESEKLSYLFRYKAAEKTESAVEKKELEKEKGLEEKTDG